MTVIMHLGICVNVTRKQAKRFISGMEQNGFITKINGTHVYFTYDGEVDMNHSIYMPEKGSEDYRQCVLTVRPTLGSDAQPVKTNG